MRTLNTIESVATIFVKATDQNTRDIIRHRYGGILKERAEDLRDFRLVYYFDHPKNKPMAWAFVELYLALTNNSAELSLAEGASEQKNPESDEHPFASGTDEQNEPKVNQDAAFESTIDTYGTQFKDMEPGWKKLNSRYSHLDEEFHGLKNDYSQYKKDWAKAAELERKNAEQEKEEQSGWMQKFRALISKRKAEAR